MTRALFAKPPDEFPRAGFGGLPVDDVVALAFSGVCMATIRCRTASVTGAATSGSPSSSRP